MHPIQGSWCQPLHAKLCEYPLNDMTSLLTRVVPKQVNLVYGVSSLLRSLGTVLTVSTLASRSFWMFNEFRRSCLKCPTNGVFGALSLARPVSPISVTVPHQYLRAWQVHCQCRLFSFDTPMAFGPTNRTPYGATWWSTLGVTCLAPVYQQITWSMCVIQELLCVPKGEGA